MSSSHTIPPAAPASLPDTMAGILEAAIADARKLDPDVYFPNHLQWHNPTDNPACCEVCLAGSIIAGRLKANPDDTFSSLSFGDKIESKLEAIDHMREGLWEQAFDLIYNNLPSHRIRNYLRALSMPAHPTFYGWPEFEAHLASMERMLPQLRSIDRAAAQLIEDRSWSPGPPLSAKQQ